MLKKRRKEKERKRKRKKKKQGHKNYKIYIFFLSICPERGWRRPSDGLAKRKWLSLLPLLMSCMCLMITDEIQCQWTAAEKSQQGWKWKPSGNPSQRPWVPPSLFYYMKCPNWLRHFSSCKTCTHAQQIYLKLFYNQQLNRRKLREKNQGYSFSIRTIEH